MSGPSPARAERGAASTPSTPPIPADSDRERAEAARFRRFLETITATAVGLGVLNLGAYLVAGGPRQAASAVIIGAYAASLAVPWFFIRRGALLPAVLSLTGGLLVGILVAALVLPSPVPLAIVPLIVVAVALPYLTPRALVRLSVVTWITATVASLLQQFGPAAVTRQPLVPGLSASAGVSATLALLLFLLWQFSSRLHETLAERERSERALRETTRTLQAVVEASPLAIGVVDRDQNVRLFNPAATAMFGWTADEVLGGPPPHIPAEQQDEYQELLARALEGETIAGHETRRRRKDGREIEISLSMAPLHDHDGHIAGVVVLALDITERRRLEGQLQQAQKMESIGRLAGGVAHDFNNLLTVIAGHADLLLDGLAPGAPEREDAEAIARAAERASALTRQLLAFSRRQILKLEITSTNEVIGQVKSMLQRLIGEHIRFVTSLAPDLGRIRVDRGQLEQVIVNLAVNARDAMPQGGTLVLETQNVTLDEAYARSHPEVRPGPHVLLAVSDTGVGMDPETMNHLFEPFFTTKERGRGTGLGLATVYGIVRQSGGSIDVYSEPGRGSTFKLYFPRVDEPLPLPQVEQQRPPERARGETILLVEDEEPVRRLAQEILERQGYRVVAAPNGWAALALFREHRESIDLLVTDVVMPEMSGRELVERLRVLQPRLRVLYISGYTDDAIAAHGVVDQTAALLEKPFLPDALTRRVQQVLGSARPRPTIEVSPAAASDGNGRG